MNETAIHNPKTTPDTKEASTSEVPKVNQAEELKAFNQIVSAVQSFDEDARGRIFNSVLTFLGLSELSQPSLSLQARSSGSSSTSPSSFSEDRTLTVKQFLFEKKPVTDIERVACLAYYFTHYRSTPHFKTLDISKLNTEAAQTKFANAANAVGNAIQAGLLAPAVGENRQISAAGERYVQELPDRKAAKEAVAGVRHKRKFKRAGNPSETRAK